VSSRQAKDALFDAFASVAQGLGNGRRAEIVDVLAQGERSVDDVATQIGQSLANTSHHLRTLARSGLVRSRRDGSRVVYRLASDRVAELWGAVRDVATEQVSAAELADRLRRGEVVVLDVRPEAEYQAGHIAGARSAPIDELAARADELPRRGEVIAYCRGPYCVYADDAVRILRARGRSARRLNVGFPEWRRAGLPVGAGGGA
jgi:rhodanese-related sulfurtransferase